MIEVESHFRQTVRRHGLFAYINDRFTVAINRVFHYSTYQTLTLNLDQMIHPMIRPLSKDLLVREIELEHLKSHVEDPAYQLDLSFIEDARIKGDLCFGAFKEDKLVAYCFFATEITAIDPRSEGLALDPPHGWIYAYKALTLNEARGQKIQAWIMTAAANYFRSTGGILGFVTLILKSNHGSFAAFLPLGFKPLHEIRVWGYADRYWVKSGDPHSTYNLIDLKTA